MTVVQNQWRASKTSLHARPPQSGRCAPWACVSINEQHLSFIHFLQFHHIGTPTRLRHDKGASKFPVNISNRFRRSSEVTPLVRWPSGEETAVSRSERLWGMLFFVFWEGASALLNHLVLFCWHLTFLIFGSGPGGRDCIPFRLLPSSRSASFGAASRRVCSLCWSHHVAPYYPSFGLHFCHTGERSRARPSLRKPAIFSFPWVGLQD